MVLATVWLLSQPRRPSDTGPATGVGDTRAASAAICGPGEAQAQLVEEVFHYGVRVRPGRAFAKRWTLQNTGGCTWGPDFRLHFVSDSGARLSTTIMDQPLRRPVPPGDTAAFVLQMRAPPMPGDYSEVWELRDGGNRVVPVGDKRNVVAMIRVPLPHYPPCRPGEGAAVLFVKKYPDGMIKRSGENFRFSWTLKNDSTCAWGPGTTLRYVSTTGSRLSRGDSVAATRSVEPGETYTFLVPMRMPDRPGTYQESWELRSGAETVVPTDGLPVVTTRLRVQAPHVPVTTAPICPPGAADLQFFDENWPDSSRVSPGQEFTKRWTVVNRGKCAWPADYRLEHVSNTSGQLARSTAAIPLGELVPPDAAYTFEVPMRGPRTPGFYREDWRFTDNRGNHIYIGTSPYLAALIVVAAARPDS